MSFYYWRTTYAPDSTETKALRENDVHTVYVRYFDVDWPETDTAPSYVSPIHFDTLPTGYILIPVVFIHNKVFEKMDSAASAGLAPKIMTLVSHLNATAHQQPTEIQFDCDWTEKTKDNYFRFLRQYHSGSDMILSSTIRLHQLKSADSNGVPPVDHGTLLFYTMGNVDSGGGNAIYERSVAHRYTPSLRTYPLTLDLALPIFSSPDHLLEMVDEVNRHSNHRIRNLIFFDLDHKNLLQYDKDIFKEVLDHTD